MHAYARGGDRHYDRVLLLYPGDRPVAERWVGETADLCARTVDLRAFYDRETGGLHQAAAMETLHRARKTYSRLAEKGNPSLAIVSHSHYIPVEALSARSNAGPQEFPHPPCPSNEPR